MKKLTYCVAAIALMLVNAGTSWADTISKEQAVAMALEIHTDEIEKAYQETKKGVVVWEVEIFGKVCSTKRT